MALRAALQICSGVGKSGSPRLKSKTRIPSAFICLAFAPAARVADGCTAAAILEIGIIRAVPLGGKAVATSCQLVSPGPASWQLAATGFGARGRLVLYLNRFAGGRQTRR